MSYQNTPTVRVSDPECPAGLVWYGTYTDLMKAEQPFYYNGEPANYRRRGFEWKPYDTVVVTHGEEFKISRIDLDEEHRKWFEKAKMIMDINLMPKTRITWDDILGEVIRCPKCIFESRDKEAFDRHDCTGLVVRNSEGK